MPEPHWTSRTPSLPALLVASVVALSACGDATPTQPADGGEPLLAVVPGGPGVTAAVRGGGHFRLKDPPPFVGDFKWVYRFSFNAEKLDDGTDQGVVTFRSKIPGGIDAPFPGDWWADVEVDCIEVDADVAWLTGTLVAAESDSPFGPSIGDEAMLIVQDNGPSGPDVVNVGPVGAFGATDCRDRPALGPDALVDGNVTVWSRP